MAIFDPLQNRHPLTDRGKICHRWLCRRPLQLYQIRCTSVRGEGGFWANGWYITDFFIYLFIPFFRELTYRSDASTDFRTWWLKRRGLAQGCAFFGFRWHCSKLRGILPPESPKTFGGVNRRFQAKLVTAKNMHIIKTTASIPTTS